MPKEYHSKYKSWILDYLKTYKDSRFCATDIHKAMDKDSMGANLATVYRNLDRLVEEKSLNRFKISNEEENYYQYLVPEMGCTSHLHLICRKCGKVIHLNCDFMKKISSHIKADHGFALDCKDSVLVGLCKQCKDSKD
jgi:Fur family ferric uptake transcriptional regulator